jgi:hypothetical protein
MGDTDLSRKQVQRDDYLRELAARPNFALQKWRKLRKDEDTVVVTYMTLYYGVEFAKIFYKTATKRRRPENVIHITNMHDAETPRRLKARGYRSLGKMSYTEIEVWVHPDGDETWLIPNSKPTVAEAKMPEDPAVEEARLYVGDLTDNRDELRRQLNYLKSMAGKPEYADAYQQFWDDFNRWQEELNERLDTTLPGLADEIAHPRDRDALQEEVKRLEALRDWKMKELLPELSRDAKPGGALPPP